MPAITETDSVSLSDNSEILNKHILTAAKNGTLAMCHFTKRGCRNEQRGQLTSSHSCEHEMKLRQSSATQRTTQHFTVTFHKKLNEITKARVFTSTEIRLTKPEPPPYCSCTSKMHMPTKGIGVSSKDFTLTLTLSTRN